MRWAPRSGGRPSSIVLPQAVGRNRHGRDSRDRARGRRDGAAPLHERALQRFGQLRPPAADRLRSRCSSSLSAEQADPVLHQQAWGAAAGFDRNHSHRQPDRALVRRQERSASERGTMTERQLPCGYRRQNPPEARPGSRARSTRRCWTAKPPVETLARDRVFGIENLTAFYGDAPAIRDVSFEIYQRMVTAIIGPSGCGKSTFFRCLNRMNDVDPELQDRGPHPVPRRRPQAGTRPGRRAPARRHGLPAPEPVPEVDLRERRLRPADPRA